MSGTVVSFDPRKKHGQVTPPEGGANFEQLGPDGKTRLYGVAPEYRRVLRPGERIDDGPPKPAAKKVEADAPKRKRGRPRKNKEAATTEPTDRAGRPFGRRANMKAEVATDDHAISIEDLREWGVGAKTLAFAPDLQNAFMHHFEREPVDEIEAGAILVEQGLLNQEDLAVSAEA